MRPFVGRDVSTRRLIPVVCRSDGGQRALLVAGGDAIVGGYWHDHAPLVDLASMPLRWQLHVFYSDLLVDWSWACPLR